MEMKASLMSYECLLSPPWRTQSKLIAHICGHFELKWNWGLLRHMFQTTGTIRIGLQQTLNCIQGANT